MSKNLFSKFIAKKKMKTKTIVASMDFSKRLCFVHFLLILDKIYLIIKSLLDDIFFSNSDFGMHESIVS